MKTNKTYTIIDTAGQKTAVVKNGFSRPEQPLISKFLMTINPNIEQVAFLEKPNGIYRCQMMGNELSVNGSLAGGYLISKLSKKTNVNLEISGLNCRVSATRKSGTISIKLPKSIVKKVNLKTVYLQGIRYILKSGFPKNSLTSVNQRQLLKRFCGQAAAAGIVYYEANKIMPLIYVKETNSFVWENACGSGSLSFYLITGISRIKQINGEFITVGKNSGTLTISSPVKEAIND